MADHIRIRKLEGVWTVRSGGAVLAETREALELAEGDYPPVVYFPRKDVAMALLDRTAKLTHCPWKGEASHYSIVNRSSVAENAVWSYEDPFDAVAAIRDHLAFYPAAGVTVEHA